jgi:hypothetical protein
MNYDWRENRGLVDLFNKEPFLIQLKQFASCFKLILAIPSKRMRLLWCNVQQKTQRLVSKDAAKGAPQHACVAFESVSDLFPRSNLAYKSDETRLSQRRHIISYSNQSVSEFRLLGCEIAACNTYSEALFIYFIIIITLYCRSNEWVCVIRISEQVIYVQVAAAERRKCSFVAIVRAFCDCRLCRWGWPHFRPKQGCTHSRYKRVP